MMTVNQVAEKLLVSRGTVVNLIKSGSIKAIKVGDQYRIPDEQFNQFLSASEVTTNITHTIPYNSSGVTPPNADPNRKVVDTSGKVTL